MKIDVIKWLRQRNVDTTRLDGHLRDVELKTALFTISKQFPSLYGAFFDEYACGKGETGKTSAYTDAQYNELKNENASLQEQNTSLQNQNDELSKTNEQLSEQVNQLTHENYTMKAGAAENQERDLDKMLQQTVADRNLSLMVGYSDDDRQTHIMDTKHTYFIPKFSLFMFWVITIILILASLCLIFNTVKYAKINKHKDTFKLIKRTRYL